MTQWQVHAQPPRQGLAHARRGVPCQDAVWTEQRAETVTAAVCDGLGAFPHSQLAAQAAAQAAARLVSDRVSALVLERGALQLREGELESLRHEILAAAREAIAWEAARSGIPAEQMDCTLLLACLAPAGGGVLLGQLGDGAICALQRNRGVLVQALEKPKRLSGQETETVLSADAADWFGLGLFPLEADGEPLDGFLLMTDGLENEIYSRVGRVRKKAEWYATAAATLDPAACTAAIRARWDELTSDESYGFTDDLGFAALVRRGVVFELPEDVSWLCVCGHRNRLESTWCENCGKDFLRVYKGVSFRALRTTAQDFFARLNRDPAEELRVLRECSDYPVELPDPPAAPRENRDEPLSVQAPQDDWMESSPARGPRDDWKEPLPACEPRDDWNKPLSVQAPQDDWKESSPARGPQKAAAWQEARSSADIPRSREAASTPATPRDDWNKPLSVQAPREDWKESSPARGPQKAAARQGSCPSPADTERSREAASTPATPRDDWNKPLSARELRDDWNKPLSVQAPRDDWKESSPACEPQKAAARQGSRPSPADTVWSREAAPTSATPRDDWKEPLSACEPRDDWMEPSPACEPRDDWKEPLPTREPQKAAARQGSCPSPADTERSRNAAAPQNRARPGEPLSGSTYTAGRGTDRRAQHAEEPRESGAYRFFRQLLDLLTRQ